MELIVSSFSSFYLQLWVEISGSEHEQERGREGPAFRGQLVSGAFWTSLFFPSALQSLDFLGSCCVHILLVGVHQWERHLTVIFTSGGPVWSLALIDTQSLAQLHTWESHCGKASWSFIIWCLVALECGFSLEFLCYPPGREVPWERAGREGLNLDFSICRNMGCFSEFISLSNRIMLPCSLVMESEAL